MMFLLDLKKKVICTLKRVYMFTLNSPLVNTSLCLQRVSKGESFIVYVKKTPYIFEKTSGKPSILKK